MDARPRNSRDRDSVAPGATNADGRTATIRARAIEWRGRSDLLAFAIAAYKAMRNAEAALNVSTQRMADLEQPTEQIRDAAAWAAAAAQEFEVFVEAMDTDTKAALWAEIGRLEKP